MIWQAVGVGLCGALICLILRQNGRKDFSMMVGLLCTAVVLFMCTGELSRVLDSARSLASRSGLSYEFFEPAIKITGIAYIAQMGAELCRDAGENAIASKVELAGKVLIAAMALPIVESLFEIVADIVV